MRLLTIPGNEDRLAVVRYPSTRNMGRVLDAEDTTPSKPKDSV